MQGFLCWRHACVAAAFIVATAGPQAAAGAKVEVQVEDKGDRFTIIATGVVDADATEAWQVLTDYARYPQFIPGVRSCRVVRRSGPKVTVEQSGTAFLGLLQVPVALSYDIVEAGPGDLWSSAEMATGGRLRSHYAIVPFEGRVSLRYAGTLVGNPDSLRFLEQASAMETATRQFQALADEIERIAVRARKTGRGAPSGEARPGNPDAH